MKASFNILLPILSLSESVADRQASGRRSGGRREEEEEEGPRGKMEEGRVSKWRKGLVDFVGNS